MSNLIIKGDIIYSQSPTKLATVKSGYLAITDGKICSLTKSKPKNFDGYKFYDFTGKLVIPGLIDAHLHAPQNSFRGTKTSLELIDWLNQNAFLEEAKFSDQKYYKRAYKIFVDELKKSATTRAVIFATLHKDATLHLFNLLEKSGLITFVGKVNMDYDCPTNLTESADSSIADTKELILKTQNYKNTHYILTPRFTPSTSRELFLGLQSLQEQFNLPVQSHLSENLGEIEIVKERFPEAEFYGKTYDNYGLFGKSKQGFYKAVMAHSVWSTQEEIDLMKTNGVTVAHSPLSNLNLSSGIAPIRKYLDNGLNVALATDVAGGHTKSMFSVIQSAIQVSKMYWRLVDTNYPPITFEEAFYMATVGGGNFFGNVGSFLKGYDADLLVLDDSLIDCPYKMDIIERLERFIYLNGDLKTGGIAAKFVKGKKII